MQSEEEKQQQQQQQQKKNGQVRPAHEASRFPCSSLLPSIRHSQVVIIKITRVIVNCCTQMQNCNYFDVQS